jgi:formylglycine-generating enzyme required for sulfatase activity
MLGNVKEWTQDCWNDDHTGAPADGAAKRTGDCSAHPVRGGSWKDESDLLRPSVRGRYPSDFRSSYLGFRIALTLAK